MTRKRAAARLPVRWPACAASLAEALPKSRLHPAVLSWIESAPRRTRWGVAFSGGADSLCLLLLLWAHWPDRRRQWRALHFDHRLRGAASRADAMFCRRVCRALRIELVAGHWSRAPRDASEADARAARQAFFDRKARVIWSGHQLDDIAETFFMRLARGSGTGGLAAPRPVQTLQDGRRRLRPLLTLRKSEIVLSLRRAGAGWCEDASNATDTFLRNRIRSRVVPAWRRADDRDALAGAARSRELLEEDDAALETWLAQVKPLVADGSLNLRRLAGAPRGLVRRALHQWIAAQRRPIRLSRQAFDTLLDAVCAGRATRQSIGHQQFAELDGRRLRLRTVGN